MYIPILKSLIYALLDLEELKYIPGHDGIILHDSKLSLAVIKNLLANWTCHCQRSRVLTI